MVMLMVMMMRVLQGHVGGDHLAARDSAAIVERVVRHSVLCPASGLAQNVDADSDKNYEDAGDGDHGKHPVVENSDLWVVVDVDVSLGPGLA